MGSEAIRLMVQMLCGILSSTVGRFSSRAAAAIEVIALLAGTPETWAKVWAIFVQARSEQPQAARNTLTSNDPFGFVDQLSESSGSWHAHRASQLAEVEKYNPTQTRIEPIPPTDGNTPGLVKTEPVTEEAAEPDKSKPASRTHKGRRADGE